MSFVRAGLWIAFLSTIFSLIFVNAAGARAAEPIAPAFDDLQPGQNTWETYRTNLYTIVRHGKTGQPADDDWWTPSRGEVYRYALEAEHFFKSVGRPDLASRAATRRTIGRVMKGGSYVVAPLGIFVGLYGLRQESNPLAIAGLVGFVAGVLAGGLSEDFERPTMPISDAADMARRYNQALLRHLGLPREGQDQSAVATTFVPTRRRLVIVPTVGPGLLGMIAGASF